MQAMYSFMAKFEELNKCLAPVQQIAVQMYPTLSTLVSCQYCHICQSFVLGLLPPSLHIYLYLILSLVPRLFWE